MSIRSIRSSPRFRQTVLIIDDQPTVLDIHSAILRSLKMNLNIVTMADPKEALEWLQHKHADLIITDFRMLSMDGMQFVEAINGIDNNCPPKAIIVITVLKDIKIHQELISAGAAACLTKPVKTDKLAEMARKLLEQSKFVHQLKLTL